MTVAESFALKVEVILNRRDVLDEPVREIARSYNVETAPEWARLSYSPIDKVWYIAAR
jgi:myo-inositol catabolism protein IolC